MCKEDVRIKRQTAVTAKGGVQATSALTPVFKADPFRVSLTLGLTDSNGGDFSMVVALGAKVDGVNVPIVAVSTGHPADRVTIEQIGILLTYDIFNMSPGAGVLIAAASSESFYKELSEL